MKSKKGIMAKIIVIIVIVLTLASVIEYYSSYPIETNEETFCYDSQGNIMKDVICLKTTRSCGIVGSILNKIFDIKWCK